MATRSVRRTATNGDTDPMNDQPTTTTDRAPSLYWDKARDIATIRAIRRGATNMRALLEALAAAPEFEGVGSALTSSNVARTLSRLRKVGIHGISLERNRGGSRPRYTESEIDELNLVT